MFSSHRTRMSLFVLVILGLLATLFEADRPAAAASGPALSVNAAAGQHSISPLIYGMNFADPTLALQVGLPVNRWGGNTTTRYNWQNDMANHASDYFFENIPWDNPDSSQLPNNSAADRFVKQNRDNATDTLLTIPLIGWTPGARKEDHPYDCGFKVSKYGAQQSVDPFDTNCGNGNHTNGTPIAVSDPHDTSIAIGPTFVQDWVRHLIGRYGMAAQGGVRYYDLDNEPGLWLETHRDVHPDHPTYDELTNLGKQYAAAIKAVDPGAQTLGPVQDGWTRYYYASYTDFPDNIAQDDRDNHGHGGKPFVEWYLQQMAAAEATNHVRLLDYFDLHNYPQAANDQGTPDPNDDEYVALGPAGNAQTQALRLRTTRSLWDPTYVDESWIPSTGEATAVNGVGVDGAVQLIPRMRDWVQRLYPGTRLAISEYNWGALESINGALAQADVLGIFGRERVDMATLWDPPAPNQPGAFAFRMYRNYDGQGSQFGDSGVSAASADQGRLAIYAARRGSDGSLTLMIINKTGGELTSSVGLSGFSPAAQARVYRYSSANLNAIVRQADQSVSASGFSATFPANSITLVVLPPDTPPKKNYLPLVRR
ncbi:MAG: glycoside hydrolase family 44 protein [Roseiflexaceae bacterium]